MSYTVYKKTGKTETKELENCGYSEAIIKIASLRRDGIGARFVCKDGERKSRHGK